MKIADHKITYRAKQHRQPNYGYHQKYVDDVDKPNDYRKQNANEPQE